MKRLIVCFLFLLGTVSISFAQSGRRIQNPIPGTSSPTNKTEVVTTEAQAPVKEETTGYSESSPNQAVSIYIDRQNRKSKKENKKKTEPVINQTPTSNNPTDEDVVKVETNLISIPVTVSTKNGVYVPSLSKGNFQIYENGKEQEVAYFGSVDKPFTAILLIDISGSTSLKIEQIQDGAIAFVQQMQPQDKAMVIAFDSGVRTLLEYSSDKNALETAIRKLRFGGGTSLYDAVDQTLERKLNKIEGKKAIVLFTDGVDTTSRTTYERTVAAAIESEAVIFPIYLNTYLDAIGIGGGGPMQTPATLGIPGMGGGTQQVGATREQYALGRRYLQDLANATGGRIYRPDNSSAGLNSAFEGIAEELRSQYEVGYYPNEEGKPGDVKKIKIRINRPNLIIRSRDSYVVK
jgi:VWFA-related protein